MKLGRREILAATAALVAACGGGGGGVASPPPPPPPPSPPPPPPSGLYPSYNTNPIAPDSSGMPSTAMEIAARIKLGWNIGNTLEAIGGENAWGNPNITQALVDSLKSQGIEAIRLPCSWDQYANQSTAKIDDAWLDRVKEVVQYCINADLYVVLNVHWDGGWLESNVSTASRDAVAAKQKAFWEQIATHLRDFDERLMFAGSNEPAVENAEQMDALLHYHQTFIDAVRSTGGRNAYRVLVVQGPSTDMEKSTSLWRMTPTDLAVNRLMLEVHFYTPSQFTIITEDQSWGRMFYYWGRDFHSTLEPDRNATWGEEDYIDQLFPQMKSGFVDAGIPVLVGEYGVTVRQNPLELDLHLDSRAHWIKYVTQKSLANGLLPFFWDVGGMIDRRNFSILDQRGFDALLEGAGKK